VCRGRVSHQLGCLHRRWRDWRRDWIGLRRRLGFCGSENYLSPVRLHTRRRRCCGRLWSRLLGLCRSRDRRGRQGFGPRWCPWAFSRSGRLRPNWVSAARANEDRQPNRIATNRARSLWPSVCCRQAIHSFLPGPRLPNLKQRNACRQEHCQLASLATDLQVGPKPSYTVTRLNCRLAARWLNGVSAKPSAA